MITLTSIGKSIQSYMIERKERDSISGMQSSDFGVSVDNDKSESQSLKGGHADEMS